MQGALRSKGQKKTGSLRAGDVKKGPHWESTLSIPKTGRGQSSGAVTIGLEDWTGNQGRDHSLKLEHRKGSVIGPTCQDRERDQLDFEPFPFAP